MGSRLIQLRKELHLTQQAFADRIGCSRAAITNYEIERSIPLDPIIAAICREFSVSESWLRHGEGSMFLPQTADQEMSMLFGRMIKNRDTDRERLVHMLLKLSDDEISFVREKVLQLAAMFEKKEGEP
jgi:transcriptional regulator with XRE-family HTH domain